MRPEFNPLTGELIILKNQPAIRGGGGGGGAMTPGEPGGGGASGFGLQNQELTSTYAYVAYLKNDNSNWFIYRRTRSSKTREYAEGTSDYATNWSNRESLSYA